DGVDNEWYYSGGRRFGRFSGIPDGMSYLKIKASNNDGIWNDEGITVGVYVKPPFWRTMWFRITLVIVSILSLWLFWTIRVKKINQANHTLKITVDKRTRELKEINEKLVELSLTDSMTGLKNRRFVDETIDQSISSINRQFCEWKSSQVKQQCPSERLVFLLLDLDFFKKVNDSYGHHAGDSVLIETGKILKSVCRRSDIVVRWGGEEFLII
ncbi:MAG: GGDEF domain-containing protein, partial [Proteobacteria bacterium]|nr:GGDEF domain-containing protein [Pseudomonadota bacterium]